MGSPWRALIALSAGFAVLAGASHADVLLFPNGARQPGQLGGAMGGAWAALAGVEEGVFYNPAGLAAEPEDVAAVGADALRYGEAITDGETNRRLDAAPGYLALAWGPSPRGTGLPVGVALFAHWPLARDIRLSGSGTDQVDASAVPDAIDPGGLDAFADGIRREAFRSGSGSLWVLATGLALGTELTGWLRAGAGLVLERVQFAEQSSVLTTFRAENASAPHESYEASVQSEARYAGQADRLVPVAGAQIRPAPGIALGLLARLPSRDLAGEGSVFLSQSSRGTFQSDTNPGTSLDDLIVVEDERSRFRLRTPLEVTFAVAFAASRMAFELDVRRSYGLDGYTVLPVPESGPPSTTAYRPPPFQTSERSVTRWAAGLSYASGDSALVFGVRDASSEVPDDDAVFRRLDLYAVSMGYVLHRGRFAASLGLAYQFALRQSVSFPSPLGESRAKRAVEYQELGIRLGASWLM